MGFDLSNSPYRELYKPDFYSLDPDLYSLSEFYNSYDFEITVTVVSDGVAFQDAFQNGPYKTRRTITRKTLMSSDFDEVCTRSQQEPTRLTVIDLPRFGTATGSSRDRRMLTRLHRLVLLILTTSLHVMIVGGKNSPAWQDGSVQTLCHDPRLQRSEQHWCRYGKDAEENPPGWCQLRSLKSEA